MSDIKTSDFSFIANMLQEKSGIALSEDKGYLVDSRLMPIAKKYGLNDISDLVDYIKENMDDALLTEIVEAMTTNESFFFRDTKPFDYLKKEIIPNILKKSPGKSSINIWSAACSTGQEPYSIAMTILEDPSLSSLNFNIMATDLDMNVMEKARDGLYSQFEVQRGVPIAMLMKYFTQTNEHWQIKDELKARIKFEKFNLMESPKSLGDFDVIFCRNVLIYFDAETKKKVLNNLCNCLNKDGSVILGASESVMGLDTSLSNYKDATDNLMPGVFKI